MSKFTVIYEYKTTVNRLSSMKKLKDKPYYKELIHSKPEVKDKFYDSHKKHYRRRMYLIYNHDDDEVTSFDADVFDLCFGKPIIDRGYITKLNLGRLNYCLSKQGVISRRCGRVLRCKTNIKGIEFVYQEDLDESMAMFLGMTYGRSVINDNALVSNNSPDMKTCYMILGDDDYLYFVLNTKFIMLPENFNVENNGLAFLLNYIECDNLDLSKVLLDPKTKSLANVFNGSRIKNLDISNFDLSNITDMHFMFFNSRVETIKINPLNPIHSDDYSIVKYKNAFERCRNLKELDLRFIDVSRVRLNIMLSHMTGIQKLWLRGKPKHNTEINIAYIYGGTLYLNKELYNYIMKNKKKLKIDGRVKEITICCYDYNSNIVESKTLPAKLFTIE